MPILGLSSGGSESSQSYAFSVKSKTNKFTNATVPLEYGSSKEDVDYALDYANSDAPASDFLEKLHMDLNIVEPTRTGLVDIQSKYYNRFKVAIPNESLTNGYAHIYFVRPDLNILTEFGKGLITSLENNQMLRYIWENNPGILKQLVSSNGLGTGDWMFYLSNKAESFSLQDETLDTLTYGDTYGGWKIAMGQTSVSSRSGGTFNIQYHDDKSFSVYTLHKVWLDYINNVYHGEWLPKTSYVLNKVLDYATALYYIVTADDGETILFWTKYFGVFPTSAPSYQISYNKNSTINTTDDSLQVDYIFSFKEDLNPFNLFEFNKNSGIESSRNTYTYAKMYDENVGHSGTSWVGIPYIERISDSSSGTYSYKLRHMPKDPDGSWGYASAASTKYTTTADTGSAINAVLSTATSVSESPIASIYASSSASGKGTVVDNVRDDMTESEKALQRKFDALSMAYQNSEWYISPNKVTLSPSVKSTGETTQSTSTHGTIKVSK